MQNKLTKRLLNVGILLSLVTLLLLIPFSKAYFSARHIVNNRLVIGQNINQINTEVSEIQGYQSDASYSDETSITNTASVDCYIRVFVAIDSTMVSIDFEYDSQNWVYNQDDGYYYYKYAIKPNESTTPLFDEISIRNVEIKETFEVLIYSESVQSYGFSSPEVAFAKLK